MAGRKRKKVIASSAAPPANGGAARSSSAKDRPKWRWRVIIPSLVVLSVLILFLSYIKFFDLLAVDRHLQDLLISYAGGSQSKAFDRRVALILVDKEKQSTPPFGAAETSHRKYHAELVRALTQAGAKVVVFDVLFKTSEPDVDPDFAAAIQDAEKAGTKIVVGAYLEPDPFTPQFADSLRPALGDHWGIVDLARLDTSDSHFVILGSKTSDAPFNGFDEQPVFPSLALEAIRLFHNPNVPTSTWFSPLSAQVRLRAGGAGGQLLESIPVNRDMEMLVALPGRDEIVHYPYHEVLSHLNDYARNFKDKIVVVGYQKNDELEGTEKNPRYRPEVHATAIATLLTRAYIKPLPILYHYLFIVMLVGAAAFLQIRFSEWMAQTQTVPLPFLPAPINKITIPTPILVVSVVYILFAILAYALARIVFDMSYHLAALIFTYFLFVIAGKWFVKRGKE